MTVRQKILFMLLGLLVGVTLTTVWSVVAQPVPGSGKSLIPYQGVLQQDGVPVDASGDNALTVTYKFFDGPGEEATEIYSQTLSTEVYQGRFTVGIGPADDSGRSVADMVRDYDDIYLGMVIGEVVMANRQKVLATPYSMATSSASNFSVTGDVQVGGNINLGGTLTATGDVVAANLRSNGANINSLTVQNGNIANLTSPAISSTNLTASSITSDNIITGNLQASNLQSTGFYSLGIPRTEDFNINSTATLAPHANHFCALSRVRFGDDNDEDDTSQCELTRNGTHWILNGRTTANEADSNCQAVCFRFR